MNTIKLSLMTIVATTLFILGACDEKQQDKNKTHKTEEVEVRHNHSQMENNKKETMHDKHEAIQNNFAHQDIIILDTPYQADKIVKEGLKEIVNAYLEMKNALVNDNILEVDLATVKMTQKVEAVDETSLKGEGKKTWQQHALLYSDKLAEMQHSKTLAEKRSYFSHISEIMYCTVKSYELKEYVTLYAVYCPMAFDGKGAYWLAETEEINNPYFGSKMLKCGEIKEKL